MANVKFAFAIENYSVYAVALKAQVPDIRIELIDMKGFPKEDAIEQAMRHKMLIPNYFQDGDKVVFIDCDVIVNKNLDDLFGKVNEEYPLCVKYMDKRKTFFNSGLFVLLVNAQTRALYKRALDMYDAIQSVKFINDEPYVARAIAELKVKTNECDCLQSFETAIDPNCYVNHFYGEKKHCDTYQNFLKEALKKTAPCK